MSNTPIKIILYFFLCIIVFSCNSEITPKPKGYLRLDYPKAEYYTYSSKQLPFTFQRNQLASKVELKTIDPASKSYGLTLNYPTLKGSIYLTYKAVNNSKNTLREYIKDAQNFTLEHTKKADEIKLTEFINEEHNLYGMFYKVGGNAASQSQFYVTDSTRHFLTGSLYFYAKPNYDSILPAATYLQKDIKQIMQTIEWK